MAAGGTLLLALAAASAPAAPLDWLVGARCTEGSAAETCERWSPMAGGMMLGTSHTVRDGRTTSFEFMRISEAGGVAEFLGSPEGAPPVVFRQIERGPGAIVFANPAHDFPQRIAYRRVGDAVLAEVSRLDGSKLQRWRYSRLIED